MGFFMEVVVPVGLFTVAAIVSFALSAYMILEMASRTKPPRKHKAPPPVKEAGH